MGSSSSSNSSSNSKKEKDNICDTNKKHIKSDASLKYNFATYNKNTTTTNAHKYDYSYNQTNNSSNDLRGGYPDSCNRSYRYMDHKSFNDLPKSATNKSDNDLSKSATCNSSNNLSKSTTNNLSNDLSKSAISKPELGKLNIHCPVLSKVDHKDTVDNVELNFVKDVLLTNEKYSFKSQKTYTENKKPTNMPAVLSLKVLAKDDFMTMWFSWKNEFLTYMKLIDQAENNKIKWGIMLLNRLGPIGQEIYRTFTFEDGQANDDIDLLIEKFDYYCTFGDKKITHDEDIDIYVNNLKTMASRYTTNVDETVKKKILEEIDIGKFTNTAKTLIPGFSFPLNIKSLTVQEVTHIWMRYENVNFKQREKVDNYSVRNCSKCSLNHAINRCPAYGKQCNKCSNMNHHWKRCPSQYKENCLYCGESHFYRECPAYMNECSKCHRSNHFSWKCGFAKVKINCNYCGQSHIASKSACSAINTICPKCMKRGHVPTKCWKK